MRGLEEGHLHSACTLIDDAKEGGGSICVLAWGVACEERAHGQRTLERGKLLFGDSLLEFYALFLSINAILLNQGIEFTSLVWEGTENWS